MGPHGGFLPPPLKAGACFYFIVCFVFFAGFHFSHPCFCYVLKMLSMHASLATVAEAGEYDDCVVDDAWAVETDPGESDESEDENPYTFEDGDCGDADVAGEIDDVAPVAVKPPNVDAENPDVRDVADGVAADAHIPDAHDADDPDAVAVGVFAGEKATQFQQVRKKFNHGRGAVTSKGKKFHYTPRMRMLAVALAEQGVGFEKMQRTI